MHAPYDFKNKGGRPTFAAKDRRKYVFFLSESYVVGQVFQFFLHFLKIFIFLEVSRVQPLFVTKNNEKHLEDMTNDREPTLQDAMRQKKMIISKKYVFCASKYPREHTRFYSKICSGDC